MNDKQPLLKLSNISVLDDKGIIKYQSSSVKVLGYDPNTLMGTNGFDIVDKTDLEKAQDIFDKVLKSANLTEKTELRIKKADGNLIFCEVYVTNLLMDDKVNGIVVNYRDISERKSYEKEIYRMAYHDYLTGLPNRFMLETSLSEEIEKLITSYKKLAILLIDLDRFKVVNDSMGHYAGDLLLKEVSKRLKETIDDKGTLFRQGGDEFIIMLTDANREVASIVSESILSSLAQPFTMNHIEIFTSPSIGITMVPEDGNSVDQILRNTYFAMYQAKRNGKNRYHFYSPPKSSNLLNPLKMEMELHRAVGRNELTLQGQGFLFSKPLQASELENRLHEFKQTFKTIGISQEDTERLWAGEVVGTSIDLSTLQHSYEPINEIEDNFRLIAKNTIQIY